MKQWCNPLSEINRICLNVKRWYFVFNVVIWTVACCMMRSFARTAKTIISVWFTVTPGWTLKLSIVWKTHCINAAIGINLRRYFHVVHKNSFEWLFFYNWQELCFRKLLCFLAHIAYWSNTLFKYQTMNELLPRPPWCWHAGGRYRGLRIRT